MSRKFGIQSRTESKNERVLCLFLYRYKRCSYRRVENAKSKYVIRNVFQPIYRKSVANFLFIFDLFSLFSVLIKSLESAMKFMQKSRSEFFFFFFFKKKAVAAGKLLKNTVGKQDKSLQTSILYHWKYYEIL